MMRIKHSVVAVSFVLTLGMAPVVYGGWVNEWIQQKTMGGPGYLNVQNRGYVSFGNMNVRFNRGTPPAPLVTFERPELKAGCGGIDIAMGGMAFADPRYLIAKFQAIIQNAAALAFDMALRSLSAELEGAMDAIEEKLGVLNKWSADECSSARQLLTTLNQGGPVAVASAVGEFFTINNAGVANEQGVGEYAPSKDDAVANNVPPVNENTIQVSCPAAVQSILNDGSLLRTAASESSLSSLEDSLRGIVGDIIVRLDNGIYISNQVPSCYSQRPVSWENLIDGTVQRRAAASGSQCVDEDPTHTGLRAWAFEQIDGIRSNMLSATALTTDQQNLINALPGAVYQTLLITTTAGTADASVEMLADFTATSLAYQALEDVYLLVLKASAELRAASSNPRQLEACKIQTADTLLSQLNIWTGELYDKIGLARKLYAAKIGEFNASVQLAQNTYEVKGMVDRRVRTYINQPGSQ